MAVSIESIKQLRDMTCASISDCKTALDEAAGDLREASKILRKRGLEIAAKKAHRATNQGRIEGYVHIGNQIGVLLEVNCETDFVARNEDFIRFTKDLAMQIAARSPRYICREDVAPEEVEKLKKEEKEEYFKTHCLLEQLFIKDEKIGVQDYLNTIIAKMGENISIHRFTRYKLGEDETV